MRKYIKICCCYVFMSTMAYSSYVPGAYPRGSVVVGNVFSGQPMNNCVACLLQLNQEILKQNKVLLEENEALLKGDQALRKQISELMNNNLMFQAQNRGLRLDKQRLTDSRMEIVIERDTLIEQVRVLSEQIRKELNKECTIQERCVRMVDDLVGPE